MKKIKYCLLALLCLFEKVLAKGLRSMLPIIVCLCCISLQAQYANTNNTKGHTVPTSGLMVGDLVPDIPLLGEARNKWIPNTLADYRGKYLLIDFWATWCAPCYAKFPLLDSIQKAYADRLQVIAVTKENKEKITAFLHSRKLDGMSFHILAGDTLLNNVFQYELIPHMIWISPLGEIQYITGGKSLTPSNLHNWLNGIPIHPLIKVDFMEYNNRLPYQANVPHASKSLQLTRNFYKRIPGLPSGAGKRITDSINRHFMTNVPLWNMYMYALMYILPYPERQLRLHIKDTIPFIKSNWDENWLSQYSFCYEVISPQPLNDTQHASLLLEDLNQNLKYRTTWKNEVADAWILYSLEKNSQLKASDQSVPVLRWEASSGNLIMNCQPLSALVDYLNKQSTSIINPPFFYDESDIDHPVDMQISLPDTDDFQALNKALKPYGLVLKKEQRINNLLILSDAY